MDPITTASSTLTDLAAASAAASTRVNTPPIPVPGAVSKNADPAAPNDPIDNVHISTKGVLAAKYVQEVRAVAPLDQQTIRQLKAAIANGNYPPPALIQGLISLVGAKFTPISADQSAAQAATLAESES